MAGSISNHTGVTETTFNAHIIAHDSGGVSEVIASEWTSGTARVPTLHSRAPLVGVSFSANGRVHDWINTVFNSIGVSQSHMTFWANTESGETFVPVCLSFPPGAVLVTFSGSFTSGINCTSTGVSTVASELAQWAFWLWFWGTAAHSWEHTGTVVVHDLTVDATATGVAWSWDAVGFVVVAPTVWSWWHISVSHWIGHVFVHVVFHVVGLVVVHVIASHNAIGVS